MLYRCEAVSKHYRKGAGEVQSLKALDLQIDQGEFVVVRGASGSGKTTLLLLLGGMMRPTGGRVWFGGQDLYAMPRAVRSQVRSEAIGFVFQMFHLVPYLSVLDNVVLGVREPSDQDWTQRASVLLEELGLKDRIRHRPPELSAGERQRTALARALLKQPRVVLADEPTGNLDEANAAEVIGTLKQYQNAGGSVVMVTHGHAADAVATRVIALEQGQVVSAHQVAQ